MEEIEEGLKLATSKREEVRKALHNLSAEASSGVLLSIKWKDLDDHPDHVHGAMELTLSENVKAERSLIERSRIVEERERRWGEIQERFRREEEELGAIERKAEECEGDLASVRMELGFVTGRVVSLREELRPLEELNLEVKREVESKEEELRHVEATLAERGKEVARVSEELRALEDSKRSVCDEVRARKDAVVAVEKTLCERRKELGSVEMRLKSIKTLTKDFSVELEQKEKEYDGIAKSIEKQSATFRLRQKDLLRLEVSADKAAGDLGKTMRELDNLTQRKEQLRRETEMSRREHSSLLDSVHHLRRDLESLKGQIGEASLSIVARDAELNAKVKQLNECENAIKEKSSLLDSKNGKLASVEVSVEKTAAELQKKQHELRSTEEQLERLKKEMEGFASKREELNVIRSEIVRHSADLESRKKDKERIEIEVRQCEGDRRLQERKCYFIQRSHLDCLQQLENKNTKLEEVKKSISDCSMELELKRKALEQIQSKIVDCNRALKEREEQLSSMNSSIEKGCVELETNVRNFRELSRFFTGLQLQYRQMFDNSWEVNSRLPPGTDTVHPRLQIKVEPEDDRPSVVSSTPPPDYKKSVCEQFEEACENGCNPAEIVLDTIQQARHQLQNTWGAGLGTGDLMDILALLELLMGTPHETTPGITKLALEEAGEWITKLQDKAGNPSEVTVLLHFMAAYKLESYFHRDELTRLAETLSVAKSDPRLCRSPGLPEKNAGTSMSCPLRRHGENKRSRETLDEPQHRLQQHKTG
ncbi:hypothetical protein MLD38_020660 [Melastoma candidum]|uniref:Uncharacterized protein n=1 Tax=Melastoma candidum TaxID=119954 RepID=A0ACB9QFI0_9MYRT|nr:hypothetical protein MLD38_020660 [Melastoma candidum]